MHFGYVCERDGQKIDDIHISFIQYVMDIHGRARDKKTSPAPLTVKG